MPDPTLDRLRAADIAPGDAAAPSFARTTARLEERRRPPAFRPRLAVPVALALAAAATATLALDTGPAEDGVLPRLGPLEAAAANAGVSSGRFSGYVQDTRTELLAVGDSPGSVSTLRESVRRVSGTEFEGSIAAPAPTVAPVAPAPLQTDAVVTTRNGIRTFTWRRPYGTLFSGALRPGEQPAEAPIDPAEARSAVASWATGEAPAGGDPELADLLREAYGASEGTQLALGYAEVVLTAPRVSPEVRAAVYDALADVPGVRIDPAAKDPAGRSAAALVSEAANGPSRSRHELFVEPSTSRILGTRVSTTVRPGANANRPEGQPPYGESTSESVYRYRR